MAYEATVASPLKECERVSRSIGIFSGKYDLNNYNASILKQTSITKHFVTGGVAGFTGGIIAVVPSGASDEGYVFEWDFASGGFKAYFPSATTELLVTAYISSGIATAMTPIYFCSSANAFVGTNATAIGSFPAILAAKPATEADTDDDCGEVSFMAIGFIRR